MKIIDLLDDRSILLDGRVADKKAALDQMVELMDALDELGENTRIIILSLIHI
mgnify:FL=1